MYQIAEQYMAVSNQQNNYLSHSFEVGNNVIDCCTSSNYDETNVKAFLDKDISDKKLIDLVSKYPEISYKEINKILSHSFGENKYFFGNGSEDLIVRINTVTRLKKLRVAVLKPLFYRIYSNLDLFEEITYDGIFKVDLNKFDLCWIVNPNSINDKYVSKNKILGLLKKYPKTSFVIDETSIFFFDNWEKKSLFTEVNKYPNLTVISSLSKYFGVPGLRFGFGATNPKFAKEISKVSATFPINSITAFYVIKLLNNLKELELYKEKININKQRIINVLRQNPTIIIKASKLNFVVCKRKFGNLYADLLKNNLLSFDMNEVDNHHHGWVRLTVHSSDKINSKVIRRLLNYLNPKK